VDVCEDGEECGCREEVCGRWCIETNNGRRMLHGNSYYILVTRGTRTLQIFLACILDRLPPNTVKSCADRRNADSTLQVWGLVRGRIDWIWYGHASQTVSITSIDLLQSQRLASPAVKCL